ncbi:MAG: glycosyltransferase family 4 protein [Chloracidobacterium sp.]|nr:glycosyltransferase family 4 protein [Chloracidobacterium sp.]
MRQIIYVWNYREWGGAQIYFLSLMKQAKKSYHVTALIPANSEPKILQYLNSLQISIEFLQNSSLPDSKYGLLGRLANRITIHRSESQMVRNILARPNIADAIFHIDLGFWQSFFSLFRLCRKTNVFMTIHTGLPLYTGWRKLRWQIKGKVISRFSSFHLLASNQEAKGSLQPYIGSQKFAQVDVTYSGIDPVEITNVINILPAKTEILKRYGLPENKTILMTVGQFIERKGCWVLLESLKQLKDAGREFVFVWLSTTLPDAETLKKVESYGLGSSFRLIDSEEIGQTREDMLTLLSSADIFILASLQEGLPIALIEAMALGLPCITTNVNAIPEAILDGQTGVLVPPRDSIQLSKAIASLLDDPLHRDSLGAAAKKTAFDKFNAQTTAERTLKLYDDVWQTNR